MFRFLVGGINARTHKNNDQEEDFKQSKFIPLSNSNALENYRESYTYDDAGNLIQTTHIASNSWTRTQEIMPDSNRLKSVSSQNGFTDSLDITYDRSGNQQQLNGNNTVGLSWNCCENLVKAVIIERPNLPNDSDYYTYDSDDMRTRKVSERLVNGGAVIEKESKIYLGNYEVKRLHKETKNGETTILKRQTLRVMDDETCVAIIHYWEQDDLKREVKQGGTRKLRYQLDNHLGSVSLEVDEDALIISYEEYFPYGGTAFIAGKNRKEVKLKEYRYSGKERDEATGLYYYGARYYFPWLGRWMSCDPSGTVDGLNMYGFVGGKAVTCRDGKGMWRRPPTLFGRGQGDHTTAFALVRLAVRARYQFRVQEAVRRGDTYQQAIGRYEQEDIRRLPGHELRRIAQIPQAMRQSHNQGGIALTNTIGRVYNTRLGGARIMAAALQYEQLNPLATTWRGGTGGGEGYALRRLMRLERTARRAGNLAPNARREVLLRLRTLIDVTHADEAIGLEEEAMQIYGWARYGHLPGVIMEATPGLTVDRARWELSVRHAMLASWAFPNAVAAVGGEMEVSRDIYAAFQE